MILILGAAGVLAGCGAGSHAVGTTSGVAAAQKAQESFRLQVQGFEARLQTAVTAFRSGKFGAAQASGTSLLTSCQRQVSKLAANATTRPQRSAAAYLRVACTDMTEAAQAGAKGKLGRAKTLAGEALAQAKLAVAQLR